MECEFIARLISFILALIGGIMGAVVAYFIADFLFSHFDDDTAMKIGVIIIIMTIIAMFLVFMYL